MEGVDLIISEVMDKWRSVVNLRVP